MYVMRMCETGRGSWFMAPHEAKWHHKGVDSFLYLVRSDDRGETWVVAPGPRPRCWTELKYRSLEEGRPINVGDAGVYVLIRTATGYLWSMRSEDDGKTWTDPEPTPLIHPSAPPMIFHLSDGQTLAAFHHNRYAGVLREANQLVGNVGQDRSEIWVSKSRDGGRTWSEPRFVFASCADPGNEQQSAWSGASLTWTLSLRKDWGRSSAPTSTSVCTCCSFRKICWIRFPRVRNSGKRLRDEQSRGAHSY